MKIRKKEHTLISEASSSYEDWKGTTIGETSMIKGSGDLYELAGLDSNDWAILGFDVSAFSHGKDPRWSIHFYAADTKDLNVNKYEDWADVDELYGGIPVVDILLHDATFDDVIKCMKLLGMQFRSRPGREYNLLHAAYADYPEQD